MPPLDPLPYRILAAIATQLMEIRAGDQYYTDAGQYVSVERAQDQDDNTPAPPFEMRVVATAVTPVKDKTTGQPSSSFYTMDVVIEAAVRADGDNAQLMAHRLIADLTLALRSNACNTPNGAAPVLIDKASILERPDGAPVVIVQLPGTVRFQNT